MIRSPFIALALGLCATPVFADPAARIVSLGGSVTEIVVALGAEDRLIGRDSTSTWPEAITALPDVGYIRMLSPEGVLSLGPDLVIAEPGAGPAEALDVLRNAGVPFIEMPGAPSPEGVLAKVDAVALALDLPEEGARLHARLAADFATLAQKNEDQPVRGKVLFVLGIQAGQVMAGGAGSSADGIIALAGADNAAAAVEGFRMIGDEAIMDMSPDLIVTVSHGAPGEGDPNAAIMAHPVLALTPAAQAGKVLNLDGMLLLGFGPRTPEAASLLHDALYGQ